jgi:hypothetical protein
LPKFNVVNTLFRLKEEFPIGLSRIRLKLFSEYFTKNQGDNFARCKQCYKLKKLRTAYTQGLRVEELWTKKLGAHIVAQRAHRELYYANWRLSKKQPENVLTIIYDKMDHSKTASFHFFHKNKAIDSFMKLPIAIIGMIANDHGDC